MANPQGRCIFCNGTGLTHEHIWADWLRNYIPRDMESYVSEARVVGEGGFPISERTKKGSGDPRSRRVRCVCGGCNSGWMSQHQEATKPHLIPLLAGRETTITEGGQTALSTWVAMAVMVAERLEPEKAAIPALDRYWLKRNRFPPPHWRIWGGHYQRGGAWRPHFVHNTLFVTAENIPGPIDASGRAMNMHSSTFVVGEFYIHLMSSLVATKITRAWNFFGRGDGPMRQIWPHTGDEIRWPPPTMDDATAFFYANALFQATVGTAPASG